MNAAARKYFPTDSATVQNNLREAAALTEVELSSRTVYQLRDLLRICGIKQTVREGQQIPIRQATRAELLKELETATNPYRLLASASIEPELVDEDIRKLDFESVFNLLKAASNEKGKLITESINQGLPYDKALTQAEAVVDEKVRSYAYEVNNWITRNYADTPHLARFYARCNARGQYRARVEAFVKKQDSSSLAGLYAVFADTLSALGKYDAEAKAKANSERLTNYADNTRTVNISKLHEWLKETLASPETSDWKSVAIAVAASTGRRLYSEILSGTGQYAVESEYELRFTGVAKGKEVNLGSYVIPTIAPAQQVVDAIAILDSGTPPKRVACDNPYDLTEVLECRSKAETRHSKNVGEHWNKRLCKQLLDLEPTSEKDKETLALMKIHGLRKLYVLHYTRGLNDRQVREKASKLLCHSGDGSVASDAYTSEYSLAD